MTFSRIFAVAAAVAAVAGLFAAATWEIDPAHTTVSFGVRHMMVSNVRGDFTKVSGTVTGDEKNPAGAKVQATIDAASIDTREPKRDQHLKSADFFDVEKYPTITFVSKKIEPAGAGRWKMSGDLTLHGVTKEVVLDVESSGGAVKDTMGKTRAGAHATTKLKRSEFGITWSKTLDGGGVLVGDDVAVTIDVEGVKQ